MPDVIKIGQLDRRVSFYRYSTTKSTTGETVKAESLYKETWAGASDMSNNENEEGKIYLVSIRNYTTRFDTTILTEGEEMFIRDADGDYYVTGIEHYGRQSYLILKTVKRE
jgi:hypothetical protein